MSNFQNLSVEQLRKAVSIKEEIERLQAQLDALAGGSMPATGRRLGRPPGRPAGRRMMSAAAKARIAAAQRARWAKLKGTNSDSTTSIATTGGKGRGRKKRVVDAATRARLAAVAKARWAKVKAAGKSAL